MRDQIPKNRRMEHAFTNACGLLKDLSGQTSATLGETPHAHIPWEVSGLLQETAPAASAWVPRAAGGLSVQKSKRVPASSPPPPGYPGSIHSLFPDPVQIPRKSLGQIRDVIQICFQMQTS